MMSKRDETCGVFCAGANILCLIATLWWEDIIPPAPVCIFLIYVRTYLSISKYKL